MTWTNRLRLLVGLVAVVVVAGLATNHMNDARGRAQSTSAQIAVETYAVGTPYAGLVVGQPVTVGDAVRAGDPIVVIDSAALRRDLAEGVVQPRAGAQDVDADGNLVVRATQDGVLTQADVTQGAFVQAGETIATVQRDGSVHVLAQYELSQQQYARLEDGAAVTLRLPDGRTLPGTTEDLSVETTGSGASRVVLSVVSDELTALAREDRLVTDGTPLAAELTLRNDGFVTDVAEAVKGYLSDATTSVTSALRAESR